MKIASILSLVTGLVALSSISPVVTADRKFEPPTDKNSTKIKTKANFLGSSGKIELCPSGDCANGQLVTLSMGRLEEFDPTQDKAIVKASNFASLDATWTDFEQMIINGVEVTTTSFVADVPVKEGKTDFTAKFNLTATIYSANGTALNGKQVVPVPAGALKFTITISDWTFASKTNLLKFGVNLNARGKDKKYRGKPGKKPKTGANSTDIDRVDMGEGMFMDAPTLALVDGVEQNITSSIEGTDKIEMVWSFPAFTESLFYDPVTGSEDATATGGSSDSTATSSASSLFTVFGGAALAALTAVLAL